MIACMTVGLKENEDPVSKWRKLWLEDNRDTLARYPRWTRDNGCQLVTFCFRSGEFSSAQQSLPFLGANYLAKATAGTFG